MKYEDKIYGKIDIEEPIILDLISGKSMQRLKEIEQHGNNESYFPNLLYSRFEHSLGVFILLKKFGAPLLEQIAGLLHDVSHTAFSHVADYVFHDGSGAYQNFQDEALEGFIEKSEIPEILKKHGIDWKDLMDDSKFPLKETELPDLCADRIDYFLRETFYAKKFSKQEIKRVLDDFVTENGKWVFKTRAIAEEFASMFLEINNLYWASAESAVKFKTTGELLKYCFDTDILTREDLFSTDQGIWEKIKPVAEKDGKLKFLLDRANNKYIYVGANKRDYDLYSVCKSRVVDPLFEDNGKLARVSEVNSKFAQLKRENSSPKEYYIKFLALR